MCGTQAVSAQEKIGDSYTVSLSYQFGFIYGQAAEIVYPSNTKAEFLSELLWDIKPVLYNGLLLELSPARPAEKPGFFSGLSLKYGVPGNSGYMEDRDWMSKESSALTHFSSHDNEIREMFLLDFSAGYSFPLARYLSLRPFINISYMCYRFSGSNGYGFYAKETSFGSGVYEPIDYSGPKYIFEGKVINYTQEWFHAAPGFSLGLFFLTYFYSELSFQISPLIICIDLDEHLRSNYQYRDYLRGGVLLEPAFRLSCAFSPWAELSAAFSWRFITGSQGETHVRSPIGTGTYIQQGIAGAGLSVMDTSLFLKIHL